MNLCFICSQTGTYYYYSAKGQSQQRKRKLPFANKTKKHPSEDTKVDIHILNKITTQHKYRVYFKVLQIVWLLYIIVRMKNEFYPVLILPYFHWCRKSILLLNCSIYQEQPAYKKRWALLELYCKTKTKNVNIKEINTR